ncbi:hypothetical protein RB2537 [Rhodopirellula baltica SH 1]|uniref:Uncharacterized protein n=1 Tax=Rhodopirellula baltica (strain DSM 10527 / NCIMB 13988 / SH1) TaxID=243090 RepID=Q7UVM1_RHOBA|nr:hypothetical protein RB2537 [Rhodopirellula baltica SH 1]
MVAITRSRLSAWTISGLLRTRETVLLETSARLAMSWIVIRPFDIGRGLIGERAERIVLNGSERSILILTRFGQKSPPREPTWGVCLVPRSSVPVRLLARRFGFAGRGRPAWVCSPEVAVSRARSFRRRIQFLQRLAQPFPRGGFSAGRASALLCRQGLFACGGFLQQRRDLRVDFGRLVRSADLLDRVAHAQDDGLANAVS